MQVQRSSRDKFYIKPDNVKILLSTYPFIISFSYLCILTYVIIMELSDWFKGFEKGLARLSDKQDPTGGSATPERPGLPCL